MSNAAMRAAVFATMFLAAAASPFCCAQRATTFSELRLGESEIIASDRARLHVAVSGVGRPCIFVHGGPGQGAASFRELKGNALESMFTMVYLDQRGSGKSGSSDNYHLSRMEADVEEVILHLGLQQVCLIAHSFGGILATSYAAHNPDRVSMLILINPLLHYRGPYIQRMQIDFVDNLIGTHFGRMARLDRKGLAQAHLAARAALMRSGQGYRFLTDDLATMRALIQADEGYKRNNDFALAVTEHQQQYNEYFSDYANVSRHVRVPTLVVAGKRDRAVGAQEHLRFQFPCVTTRVIDGGHILYFEHSSELVLGVRDFVASPRGCNRT